MPTHIIAIVLFAALLHASWNAMAKSGGSPLFSIAAYQLFGSLVCLPLLGWVERPAADSWVYIGASVVLHNLYYFSLAQAYRAGDLSQMYPLLRGLAPVLVAVAAGVLAGEWLPAESLAGLALISLGLVGLTLFGGQLGKLSANAICWGVLTALLIALYTVADGLGVRAAGNSLAYIVWLFAFESAPICVLLMLTRRRAFVGYLCNNKRQIVLGGIASSVAYGLVIYAMNFGALALVSSLRETSVVFAAIIGAVWLGEAFGKQRIFAASLVALGVLVLRH